jgi:DNA-binding CsgD family transcriptional regulator
MRSQPTPGNSGLFSQAGSARREHLTPRQLEVLALMCKGMPNKRIAQQLDISNGTVKAHVTSIFRTLNVRCRLQAVVTAMQWNTLTPAEPRPAAGEGARALTLVVPRPGLPVRSLALSETAA